MTAIVVANLPLENGSILVVRPHEHPYILHFGVLLFHAGSWKVMHNNEESHVHMEELESLLKRADYVTIQRSPVTGQSALFLLDRFEQFKDAKYDLVEFNCETFVNHFTNQKPISRQAIIYTLLAAFWLFVIFYLLWKQKLKSLL